MSELVYFIVPYDQKDKAKAMGARWNNERRKWYMPCTHSGLADMLEAFAPADYIQDSSAHSQLVNANLKRRVLAAREEARRLKRIRFHIDYDNRERAKELGAKWDPLLSCWYVEDGNAHVAELKRL